MKLEKMVVATVHDQSGIYPSSFDLFQVGPVVAWSFDRKAAERFAARQSYPTRVVDTQSEILTHDDGTMCRIQNCPPLDSESERKAALDALLCRLTPDERELLNGVSS